MLGQQKASIAGAGLAALALLTISFGCGGGDGEGGTGGSAGGTAGMDSGTGGTTGGTGGVDSGTGGTTAGTGGVDSGTGGSTGGTGGSVPLEELPTAWAHAVCDNIADCCAENGWTHDAAKCVEAVKADVESHLAVAGLAVTYDAQLAGECVEAIAIAVRQCTRVASFPDLLPEKCASVAFLAGTKAAGEPCSGDLECVRPPGGGAFCETSVCVQYPPGNLGDACAATCAADDYVDCVQSPAGSGSTVCYLFDSLHCADDGTCQPLAAIGEPCTKNPDVTDLGGDWCAADATCSNGVCSARKAVGEPCEGGEECIGGHCTDGMCGEFPNSETCTGVPPTEPPESQVVNNSGALIQRVNVGDIVFAEVLHDTSFSGFKKVAQGTNRIVLYVTDTSNPLALGSLGPFSNNTLYAVNIRNLSSVYCAELWQRTDIDITFYDDTNRTLIATTCEGVSDAGVD